MIDYIVIFQKYLLKFNKHISKLISKRNSFLSINRRKKIKQCYICRERFEKFSKYYVNQDIPRAINHFQLVGSDFENFGCYYCNSTDRERHLFMFFDKINFWEKFENQNILHIAPEYHLMKGIEKLHPNLYIKGDLYPKGDQVKMDITSMKFNDNTFDIVICNHVLEHISNHYIALKEIARVLKPHGIAILQTPYSELLYNHFEDENINNDDLRLNFYGQEDHVKIISRRAFYEELSRLFIVSIIKHSDLFDVNDSFKYGVNENEDLIMVFKENNNG